MLLTEEDVRSMVRLVGEAASLDAGQVQKRRLLMNGLAKLVNADVWVWTISRPTDDDGRVMTMGMIHEGLSEEDYAKLINAETDPSLPPPHGPALMEEFLKGNHVTRGRQQIMDDDEWYKHPHTKHHLEGWMENYIFSIYPLGDPPTLFSGIGLLRRWGSEPFTARENRIAHIVTSEVPWLHSDAVPATQGEGIQSLPPRFRKVLPLLMEGHTRKRIAEILNLSQHTIADYVKQTYKHFNLNSRNALMRHFMTGDGGDIPTTASTTAKVMRSTPLNGDEKNNGDGKTK
jgi:DNA-binding CsgD family transcriptional regulator